jgi:predicted TPR repeat methyltransferase
MRQLLKRIPGASRAYQHSRVLLDVAYEGWLSNRRKRFDRLLATDVWDFEKPTTTERYARALEATGRAAPGRWGTALELGCGIGVFTDMLAARCERVVATDISAVGCERTRERCRAHANLTVHTLDLREEELPGPFDLVFAMDVLECIHGPGAVRTIARKLAGALHDRGHLIITMSRLPSEMSRSWWARRLVEGGDAMTDYLDGRHGLALVSRDLYPKYLVAVLEKSG